MTDLRTSENLPAFLSQFFWDCDFSALNWASHRDFIIHRLLKEGDWETVCWVRAQIGDEALYKWIEGRQGVGLTLQQLRFWQVILRLPTKKVEKWIRAARKNVWERSKTG